MSLTRLKTDIHINKKQIALLLVFILLLLIADGWLLRTNGWPRLFSGIFLYAGLYLIYRFSDLRLNDIGLSKDKIKPGLDLAFRLIGIYFIFLIVVYAVAGNIFRDPRYDHSVGTAIYAVLLILPLKTIFFEELVFRGLLPGMIKSWSSKLYAMIFSSILFGLWHFATALDIRGSAALEGHTVPAGIILLGVFLATSTTGYLLCYIRYKSDSLVTPILLHWFINGSAILLATLTWL